MGIHVGTLITRYDPYEEDFTCENGTCVGVIAEIMQYPAEPDNPSISTKWYDLCEWHKLGDFNLDNTKWMKLDETYEIGQIPQR